MGKIHGEIMLKPLFPGPGFVLRMNNYFLRKNTVPSQKSFFSYCVGSSDTTSAPFPAFSFVLIFLRRKTYRWRRKESEFQMAVWA